MAPWDGIQEFLMVVETGSFTRAGKRLGVSASHVSRQVKRLEDRLGVKLLARSTRIVRLTDAGASYHRRVSDLAAGFDEANQGAAGDSANLSGHIRVSVGGRFTEQEVAPLLARFVADNPGVSMELDFDSRYVNLIDRGYDFAIRYGALADSGLIARKLSGRTMVCTAAPSYLARQDVPAHPHDLRSHACLITNSDRWIFNDPKTGDAFDVRVSGPWRSNNVIALRFALLEGLGIAYVPVESLRQDLATGALVPILEGYEDQGRSNWIIYAERRHMPLRVRRAIDFLLEAFQRPREDRLPSPENAARVPATR